VIDHTGVIDPPRHLGQTEQGFEFGSAGKEAWRLVVIQRLDAHVVAGTKQPVLASIPQGEGKISQ
jgi:hypothetical protein